MRGAMDFKMAFRAWLPLAIAITGLCLLVYTVVQQNYRQSLDDPQIQMAEDTANALLLGATVESVLPTQSIWVNESLSPWIAVFDEKGDIVDRTTAGGKTIFFAVPGFPNGEPVALPKGVFDTATWLSSKKYSSGPIQETRFTWQPERGTRQAVVLVQVRLSNTIEYVAAGRNMREVEDRIGQMSTLAGIAWASLLGATLLVQLFLHRFL